MEILQVKNLSFSYPEATKKALDSVSFSVEAGEFAVLCGESGCGKTTLLKLLKTEIAPFGELEGEIFYSGKPLATLNSRTAAAQIGFVMQDPESQIVTDTVWHELAFGLENLGLPTELIRRRVAEMASFFGIEGWFRKKTYELSGGQKQLLNLASVMVMQPKILLLDEPTAQLDPIAAANFIATLQKLNRELGLTVILSEHRLEEVFPISDKCLLISGGRLCFAGEPYRINEFFSVTPNHPMYDGMPAAMRIFSLTEGKGKSPLTVKEGRKYITENFTNGTDELEVIPYNHSEVKAVELKSVWFSYGKELPDVLRGADLRIYKGEHFCILGGNGAGKTTALKIMAGLLKPVRGKVFVNGKKITDYKSNELYRENIAFLPQNPQTVFLEKTVAEELQAACSLMGFDKNDWEGEIGAVTEMLGISALLDSHPYDLSGGEQQKAALAKMLLLKPQILLLDEPTKGIDAFSKRTLAGILRKLKADGITIITVTHDVEFAASYADRCALFFDGVAVSTETPVEFFGGNNFYTTAPSRISRGYYKNAVTCEQLAELCRKNMRKGADPYE